MRMSAVQKLLLLHRFDDKGRTKEQATPAGGFMLESNRFLPVEIRVRLLQVRHCRVVVIPQQLRILELVAPEEFEHFEGVMESGSNSVIPRRLASLKRQPRRGCIHPEAGVQISGNRVFQRRTDIAQQIVQNEIDRMTIECEE